MTGTESAKGSPRRPSLHSPQSLQTPVTSQAAQVLRGGSFPCRHRPASPSGARQNWRDNVRERPAIHGEPRRSMRWAILHLSASTHWLPSLRFSGTPLRAWSQLRKLCLTELEKLMSARSSTLRLTRKPPRFRSSCNPSRQAAYRPWFRVSNTNVLRRSHVTVDGFSKYPDEGISETATKKVGVFRLAAMGRLTGPSPHPRRQSRLPPESLPRWNPQQRISRLSSSSWSLRLRAEEERNTESGCTNCTKRCARCS